MGSVKPRLTRSFSSPLVDSEGLGCDLALTGVSVGHGPVTSPGTSGHKLESSRSLQASDIVTSSGDRGETAMWCPLIYLHFFSLGNLLLSAGQCLQGMPFSRQ